MPRTKKPHIAPFFPRTSSPHEDCAERSVGEQPDPVAPSALKLADSLA
jgi:hypothetical protein